MAISSTSGTLSHGQSVTLSGTGFGTKDHAGPMVYDDFDDKSSGDIAGQSVQVHQGNLLDYSTWSAGINGSGGLTPQRNSTTTKTRSTHHTRSTFDISTGTFWASFLKIDPYNNFTTGEKLYFSYYFRINMTTATFGRQCKPWIVYNSSTSDRAYFNVSWDCPSQNTDHWFQHRSTGPADETSLGLAGTATDDEWLRLDFYLKQSASGTANGSYHSAICRPTIGTPAQYTAVENNYIMRGDSTDWVDWRWGGGYYDMCDDVAGNETATVDLDELYIDKTPRRVELGNASTYSACTFREIQRATSWSDTSVTVVLNAGYFSDNATAYLYVLDDDNAALFSGNGFQVTLGGAGGAQSYKRGCGISTGGLG